MIDYNLAAYGGADCAQWRFNEGMDLELAGHFLDLRVVSVGIQKAVKRYVWEKMGTKSAEIKSLVKSASLLCFGESDAIFIRYNKTAKIVETFLASQTLDLDLETVNLTKTLSGDVISCCISKNCAHFLVKSPNSPFFSVKRVLFGFSERFLIETIVTSSVNWPQKDLFCKISGGRTHFGLLAAGSVYTWGSNLFAAVCPQSDHNKHYPNPRKIPFFEGLFVDDVQCGYWHTAVKTKFGALYCFGSNKFGQLGPISENGGNGISLCELPSGQAVKKVWCGSRSTVIQTESGNVYRTGYEFGQKDRSGGVGEWRLVPGGRESEFVSGGRWNLLMARRRD